MKVSKFYLESFYCVTNRRVVFKFLREIGEIVSGLPDKKNKNLPDSTAVATAQIAPKICQGHPPTMYSEYSRFHPNAVHFQRSYSRTREHRQDAP